jgi:hypothetical protein
VPFNAALGNCLLLCYLCMDTCLVQHTEKLVPGFTNAIAVIAIDHKDKPLSVLEIMPP